MTTLTPGASLAWRIAQYEAMHLNAEYIEPEHLFIGVLSLGKIISGETDGETADNDDIAKEWDALSAFLEITGNDPVVLRRLLRSRLQTGVKGRNHPVIHRSPACKECFARASQAAGTALVSANDLFSVIMEQPGEKITSVISEGHFCSPADRVTDLLLPRNSPSGSFGFNIRDAFVQDIDRYTASLSRWQPGSKEHELTIKAIRIKAIDLIHFCCNENDPEGLLDAITMFLPFAGQMEDEWKRVYEELKTSEKVKEKVPDPIKTQIKNLLKKPKSVKLDYYKL